MAGHGERLTDNPCNPFPETHPSGFMVGMMRTVVEPWSAFHRASLSACGNAGGPQCGSGALATRRSLIGRRKGCIAS